MLAVCLHLFQALHQGSQEVLSVSHVLAGFRQVADELALTGNASMALYDVASGSRQFFLQL
jgi:hypothetical protein